MKPAGGTSAFPAPRLGRARLPLVSWLLPASYHAADMFELATHMFLLLLLLLLLFLLLFLFC